MAYLVRNDPTDYHFSDFTVYIQSSGGVIANTDSSYLFYMFSNLSSIEGLEHLDTSNVTNMSHMFDQDQPNYVTGALVELNVSSFDTSNVTNMSYMFRYCSSLTTLDLSNFDTNNVTEKYYMFGNMLDSALVRVKDKTTQDWILALQNYYYLPSAWSTDNVIIKS